MLAELDLHELTEMFSAHNSTSLRPLQLQHNWEKPILSEQYKQ